MPTVEDVSKILTNMDSDKYDVAVRFIYYLADMPMQKATYEGKGRQIECVDSVDGDRDRKLVAFARLEQSRKASRDEINYDKERGSMTLLVSHPDDEVLGCGGTIARCTDSGDEVYVCVAT